MSDTTIDDSLQRNFNLLQASPTFALNLKLDGSAAVSSPPRLDAGTGTWLVHGHSTLPAGGDRIVSAFVIDTDGGGDAVMHAYWQTPKGWCSTSDASRLPKVMGRPRDALFPCRFETTIPLGPGLSLH